MKQNVGKLDRLIRFSVAVLLIVIGILIGPTTPFAIVLFALSAALVVTASVSFCGIYAILGISSCPRTQSK